MKRKHHHQGGELISLACLVGVLCVLLIWLAVDVASSPDCYAVEGGRYQMCGSFDVLDVAKIDATTERITLDVEGHALTVDVTKSDVTTAPGDSMQATIDCTGTSEHWKILQIH